VESIIGLRRIDGKVVSEQKILKVLTGPDGNALRVVFFDTSVPRCYDLAVSFAA